VINTYQEQSLLIAKILYKYSLVSRKKEIEDYYANIHQEFFNLKKKYPKFFDRLFFDNNGHLPFSKDLDYIIQDFQVAGIINKLNPKFNTLIINSEAIRDLIEKKNEEIPEISEEEVNAMVGGLTL